jgi:hypothetical protein
MSIGKDYISELWPLMGLLFISQMIYDYGEPWWNNMDREYKRTRRKSVPVLLCPPEIPHGLTRASVVIGQ